MLQWPERGHGSIECHAADEVIPGLGEPQRTVRAGGDVPWTAFVAPIVNVAIAPSAPTRPITCWNRSPNQIARSGPSVIVFGESPGVLRLVTVPSRSIRPIPSSHVNHARPSGP